MPYRLLKTPHSACVFFSISLAVSNTASFAQQPDPIIESARQTAAIFAQQLPDYIVKRTTTRYQGRTVSAAARQAGKWIPPVQAITVWRTLDTVNGDVTAQHGGEIYNNIAVNGRPAKNLPGGEWSAGEFSTALLAILAPESAAQFTNQRAETIRNRPAFRYDYAIDHAHSIWRLDVRNRVGATKDNYSPPYGGAIWIDRATGQVLRIEMSARYLPGDYAMDLVESATDYDFVKIGDATYSLPVHSEAFSCQRYSDICLRNDTVFFDYNKFAANTNITFDENAAK